MDDMIYIVVFKAEFYFSERFENIVCTEIPNSGKTCTFFIEFLPNVPFIVNFNIVHSTQKVKSGEVFKVGFININNYITFCGVCIN